MGSPQGWSDVAHPPTQFSHSQTELDWLLADFSVISSQVVLGHITLGLFSQVSEVLLKPSRDLICSVKCWVCFRAASTAHGAPPRLCNLFGCSGSSTHPSKALFGHSTFVLIEQKAKMCCHLQVGSVDLCLYREWFIYYIVICKGARTSWWSYGTTLSLSAWFSQWCSLWFNASSGEVHIRRPVRFLHNSSSLGNLLLVWHGKEGGKRNHTRAFQAILRSCKSLSYVVVCLHHVSPFSFSCSNSLGSGVYFLQEQPLIQQKMNLTLAF